MAWKSRSARPGGWGGYRPARSGRTLAVVLLAGVAGTVACASPSLSKVQADVRSVPRYGKFELTFQARGSWTNPFDPDQVAIDTWDCFGRFRFPLAAGAHRVTVANTRPAAPDKFWRDRVTVAYELTNYRLRRGPDLDWAGLQSDACILLWLHNPGYTWLFARLGRPPELQPEGLMHLRNLKDGNHTVLWRDTWTGAIMARDTAEAKDGRLALRTPASAKSAVAKLSRIAL